MLVHRVYNIYICQIVNKCSFTKSQIVRLDIVHNYVVFQCGKINENKFSGKVMNTYPKMRSEDKDV